MASLLSLEKCLKVGLVSSGSCLGMARQVSVCCSCRRSRKHLGSWGEPFWERLCFYQSFGLELGILIAWPFSMVLELELVVEQIFLELVVVVGRSMGQVVKEQHTLVVVGLVVEHKLVSIEQLVLVERLPF